MSDKATTVHEKAHFHICNGGLTIEISSTEETSHMLDGQSYTSNSAQISFKLSSFDVPLTTHVPILSSDFLQTLSDMALRAKATLEPQRLDPGNFVSKPRFEVAWSKPVLQREATAAFASGAAAVVNVDHSNGDLVPAASDPSYPIRGGSCGNHDVGGITYKYNVSYIKEAADKPWTADSDRVQEFTPAADEPTAATITAHVLAHLNNHPDTLVGHIAIKP